MADKKIIVGVSIAGALLLIILILAFTGAIPLIATLIFLGSTIGLTVVVILIVYMYKTYTHQEPEKKQGDKFNKDEILQHAMTYLKQRIGINAELIANYPPQWRGSPGAEKSLIQRFDFYGDNKYHVFLYNLIEYKSHFGCLPFETKIDEKAIEKYSNLLALNPIINVTEESEPEIDDLTGMPLGTKTKRQYPYLPPEKQSIPNPIIQEPKKQEEVKQ